MALRILYRDDACLVVDKPAGFHVHAPEDARHRISPHVNCVKILRRQLGVAVHPVHRLDRGTSGVLLFALDSEAAAHLQDQFVRGTVGKTYYCVVRGWLGDDVVIHVPLKNADTGTLQTAETHCWVAARAEMPWPSAGHPTSRYSVVRARPITGRTHQIRRHLRALAHPVVGDAQHGDPEHNRIFRGLLGVPLLLLKAYSLEFTSPAHGRRVWARTRWNAPWHRVFELLGVCPCEGAYTAAPHLAPSRIT